MASTCASHEVCFKQEAGEGDGHQSLERAPNPLFEESVEDSTRLPSFLSLINSEVPLLLLLLLLLLFA